MSAKKITTLFYIFRILYDFSKKDPLIFGELSILPGIFGFWGVFYANNCAYRSQRPHGTKAQFKPERRPGQLACRPADRRLGQPPAKAEAECQQTAAAHSPQFGLAGQIEGPDQRRQKEQRRQLLPAAAVGPTRCQLELFSIKRSSTVQ